MTALTLILVLVTAAAVAWLSFEVHRLRERSTGRATGEASPEDLAWVEETLVDLGDRVASLEARLPGAIQHVGTVAYDAYGDVAGALSRSVAMLDGEGNGAVLTHLVGRSESRFFVKGVREGRGEEPLSPEEQEAVHRALGG